MAIQVIQRRQEAVQQKEPKKDLMDEVLKGLQIANGILGIKGELQQSEVRDAQLADYQRKQDTAQRIDRGELTQAEIASGNFGRAVPAGTEGAQKFYVPAQGEGPPQETFLLPENVAKSRETAAAAEAAAIKQAKKIAEDKRKSQQQIESGLRNEYFKASNDVSQALKGYRKVEASATGEPTGASDLALIFGYMKTIDPGSTVREGEFANAEEAQGVPDRIRSLYNKILQGERLNPSTRQEFLASARNQMISQLKVQMDTDDRFSMLAKRADADVEDVIDPRYRQLLDELSGQGSNEVSQQQKPVDPNRYQFSTRGVIPSFGDKAQAAPQGDALDKFLRE